MTTPDPQTAQTRMDLAEALTDASRSLDRARRRIEAIVQVLSKLNMPTATAAHVQRCQTGIVEIQQLNNDIRKMNV